MRVLVANDGFRDAGGVQSYLDVVLPGLAARGHTIATLHPRIGAAPPVSAPPFEMFSIEDAGTEAAFARVSKWHPDVCFSHNMWYLDVERRLLALAPTVKFMHGYFGTCISGQKSFGWPRSSPCQRVFGAGCLAAYYPRHCGGLNFRNFLGQYRWALEQRALFGSYAAVVVASAHMRDEYMRNGVDPERLHVNPLFSTAEHCADRHASDPDSAAPSVAFFGRMTTLKGGDLLIRAAADAARRIYRPVHVILVGDGPQRENWEALARRLDVPCTFAGWQHGERRWEWLRGVHLMAVPSTWPEPFGLVGLEAAAFGVPAIAFDVGGVREWLRPGENGYLVDGRPPRASALADALVTAFTRPAELSAMRQGARRMARSLSVAAHLDRLEQVLSGAHAHPAGR
jgi:glycosyltransferase involved in cell wall biosynthesis